MTEHAFISYVRDNSEIVDRLANELRSRGVKVWLDREDILPGQFWQDAIRSAISNGAFFIACFSREMNRRSETYMHGELRFAIDRLRRMPRDRVWFIPIMLNETEIPNHPISDTEHLSDLNVIKIYQDWEKSVTTILKALGIEDKDVMLVRQIQHIIKNHYFKRASALLDLMNSVKRFNCDDKSMIRALTSKERQFREDAVIFLTRQNKATAEAIAILNDTLNTYTETDLFSINEQDLLLEMNAIKSIGPLAERLVPLFATIAKEHKNESIRLRAIDILGDIGTPESGALEILKIFLADKNDDVTRYAASAIGRFEYLAITLAPNLISLTKSEHQWIKEDAIHALGHIGDISLTCIDRLVELFADEDDTIRKAAVVAAGYIFRNQRRPQLLIDELFNLLGDESEGVRREVLSSLLDARDTNNKVLDQLVALLNDKNDQIRADATTLIGNIGPQAAPAVPALIDRLKDRNDYVKRNAIYALESIGNEATPALSALREIFLSEDRDLAYTAYCVIENILKSHR